jgi:hypothetical protein
VQAVLGAVGLQVRSGAYFGRLLLLDLAEQDRLTARSSAVNNGFLWRIAIRVMAGCDTPLLVRVTPTDVNTPGETFNACGQ